MTKRTLGRLLIAAAASVYFALAWMTPGTWRFFDYVNLILHEAGHPLLMPLGETMSFLGGTLFQLLIPLVFAIYFYWHGQKFSSGLVLFWLSESLGNVSVYASDALKQQLPLLGGDGSIHDWNWLLLRFGMLRHALGVGEAIHLAGLAVLAIAAYLTFRHSFEILDKKTGDPRGTA